MSHRVQVGPHRRSLDPQPFRTPGAFLAAVRAATLGGPVDPALVAASAVGQNTYAGPDGGFFVPTSLVGDVLAVGATDDPSIGRMLPVPMRAPIVNVPARVDKTHATSVSGGIVVYRVPEADNIPDSRMKFETIRLDALETTGLSFVTQALALDSVVSFEALLEAGFRDAFSERHLEEKLRGTGVGEFAGVLRSPATVVVEKESGQAQGSVTAKNLLKMRARAWGYRRAVWLVHPELFEQVVVATAPIGDGGALVPIWQPGSEADDIPDRILGRPAYFSSAASLPGDLGDVVLVDWSQVLNGVWRPVEGVLSIHARFQANENAYRFMERSYVSPWWTAALMPTRATVTLSPYVTLADRS